MDLIRCQIEYCLNGQRGKVIVNAPSSIDGLLMWLDTVPQNAGIKAIVKVFKPLEIV